MTLHIVGRLAGALALTVGLAGCIDASVDVKVQSETEAQAVMTQTIGAQFYPMIKASKSADTSDESDSFCGKADGGTLVENADGSATCTITKQGKFAALGFDSGKESMTFTSAGPGLVRVAFPTEEFAKGLDAATKASDAAGAADADAKAAQEQMKTMMTAYFTGHFLTVKVEGGEITDSNMPIAPDRHSAEQKIPFTDILAGTAKLPPELYAVVKVN
jgi:hypothetical protein